MTPITFTSILLLMASAVMAQDRQTDCLPDRYEVGGFVGRNQYFGDLHCSTPYASTGFNMSLQGFIRRDITQFIKLRSTLSIGQLAASDLDNPDKRWDYRRVRFKSPLVELSVQAEVFPLGKKQGEIKNWMQRLSPYGFVGLGVVYTNPTVGGDPRVENIVGLGAPDAPTMAADAKQKTRLAPILPVGLGLAVAVTPKLRINAELGYRFTTSDYLDGFKLSAYQYSQHNDSYLILSVGAAYRLGSNDSDGDGVADKCDDCRQLAGLASLRGCPDADNDGVMDLEDSCPDEFGDPATCGCADDDLDGVPNSCDCCPTQAGERAYHGCTKQHQIEYEHIRTPASMRYCPLCPPDLPSASRTRRTNRSISSQYRTR